MKITTLLSAFLPVVFLISNSRIHQVSQRRQRLRLKHADHLVGNTRADNEEEEKVTSVKKRVRNIFLETNCENTSNKGQNNKKEITSEILRNKSQRSRAKQKIKSNPKKYRIKPRTQTTRPETVEVEEYDPEESSPSANKSDKLRYMKS